MNIKELNETYDKLVTNINTALDNNIDINDPTIIYELDQNSIDEGSYDYYIDCYDRHGATYEMSIERVQKNGMVYGYMNDLGTSWEVRVGEILNIADKLTILNILNNESN